MENTEMNKELSFEESPINYNKSYSSTKCSCGMPLEAFYLRYKGHFAPHSILLCTNPECSLSVDPSRIGHWEKLPDGYQFYHGEAKGVFEFWGSGVKPRECELPPAEAGGFLVR